MSAPGASGALAEVAERLRADGALLEAALTPAPDAPAPSVDARFAVAFEAIREGYLLHYAHSRILDTGDDPDLALLAGDRLYALGLAELAEVGDLFAVCAMADVIARSAAAHAAGDSAAAERAWKLGTLALAADR